MLAKLSTYSLIGIEALPVEVEVVFRPGRCRRRFWSGWQRRRLRRARIASSGRSSTADISGPSIGS